MFKESLFNRIEKKTNIKKETILSLADKIKQNNLKDEKSLREVIQEISKLTGKEVSKEKENKIIEAIQNNEVPNNIDKMF